MKLNFKGFFKAAGLFPLALMLSGCISYALVSHTARVLQESINRSQTPSRGYRRQKIVMEQKAMFL